MLTLFLCGDVMTGRGIDQILAHPSDPTLHEPYVKDARQYVELAEHENGKITQPVDDRYIWGFALNVLDEVNPAARIINLETSVTGSDRFWKGKGIHYRMSPKNTGCLSAARIDCCTLANNHVLDWGYEGLGETLQSLQDAGLKTAGAGSDEAAAEKPAVLSANASSRILVFGLGSPSSGVPAAWAARRGRPGVAFLPNLTKGAFDDVAKSIDAARRDDSDIVIASIHWGGNWGFEVPGEQIKFAHRLIDDAGVDVVHGHSSHHVKGIEVYRDRLILHGSGDLITDYEGISGKAAFRGELGLMYFPRIDPTSGKLDALRMQPTKMQRLQLRRPPTKDIAWLEKTLNREGRPFGTKVRLGDDGMFHLQWK